MPKRYHDQLAEAIARVWLRAMTAHDRLVGDVCLLPTTATRPRRGAHLSIVNGDSCADFLAERSFADVGHDEKIRRAVAEVSAPASW